MKRASGAMHVDTIRRRHGERVYESFLVRRSIREGKRVRKETIANLSGLPAEVIEAVRRVLAGETVVPAGALNSRPRKTLGWKTPAEALDDHLRSLEQATVATSP